MPRSRRHHPAGARCPACGCYSHSSWAGPFSFCVSLLMEDTIR
ncbi:hypothetical protein Nmel_007138 [Mimus melanotis]